MTERTPDRVLNASDLEHIRARGISEQAILRQIDRCRFGAAPVTLHRPATPGDGIDRVAEGEQAGRVALHDDAARTGRCLTFVPASGAATRMFRQWYSVLNRGGFGSREEFERFRESLAHYAFCGDLQAALSAAGQDLEELASSGRGHEIIEFILGEKGLHYGFKPKALLKFHQYGETSRTALEEHLVEAALYVRDGDGRCRIHFTVSQEHLKPVSELLDRVTGLYENKFGVRFEIGLSVQGESTDTVAVDLENRPFRDRSGRLVFRPGGHGALLYNLDAIDGDIVFIKNIDNIVPDRLKHRAVLFKKILGGCLVGVQRELFGHLRALSESGGEGVLDAAARFAAQDLNCAMPPGFGSLPADERRRILTEKLNRPLRVCGMVRNEGEPGGGPFWVVDREGGLSLQIVEEVQVDRRKEDQAAIWASSTHFNPVDLVCGIRDFRGRKFALERFVDGERVFVSTKSHEGCDIKALELPGLWNGSMAFWHTVFVEVPIETFNPVKTVEDLLRPAHRA